MSQQINFCLHCRILQDFCNQNKNDLKINQNKKKDTQVHKNIYDFLKNKVQNIVLEKDIIKKKHKFTQVLVNIKYLQQ